MPMLVFALSLVSTVLYLGSLIALQRWPLSRHGWALTLLSLLPTIGVVILTGAYPSLVGCVVGAAIAGRRLWLPPPPM